MTAEEWLAEIDFRRRFRFVEARLSERKRRLLAVAFCRAIWHVNRNETLQTTVELAETFADGNSTVQELDHFKQLCREVAIRSHEEYVRLSSVPLYEGDVALNYDPTPDANRWELESELAWTASYVANTPIHVEATGDRAMIVAELGLLDRVRMPRREFREGEFGELVAEIAGNPFEPVEFLPEWRTSTATALAREMYRSRDFSAMPILADALQDAGCDSAAVLDHCRDPNAIHVRGCWAVDLLLDKS